jgi:hypothetical protein
LKKSFVSDRWREGITTGIVEWLINRNLMSSYAIALLSHWVMANAENLI